MSLSKAHVEPYEWQKLRQRTPSDWEDGTVALLLFQSWCRQESLEKAAIYAPQGSGFVRQLLVGDLDLPEKVGTFDDIPETVVELAGGFSLVYQSDAPPQFDEVPLELALVAALKLHQLSDQLKEQSFQDNLRTVELEAVYDVGLAIASTLNLEELSEEILLRAVSLLDARRGALYFLRDGHYALERAIGGDALPQLDPGTGPREESPAVAPPANTLPGCRFLLSVPIEIEGQTQGILVVGDREHRTGVGPFRDTDRRSLSLFANQAAIAIANANLHRQALEKERLERELELAAEIQRSILPADLPHLGGLELVGWNRPTQQVGGDYYGSLGLGDGRVGLVVADVTGKGMPAALLVSTLHSALRLLVDRGEAGDDLLVQLNQHIAESSGNNKFITLIFVDINRNQDQLGFVNAGHNPGLLVRANGEVDQLQPSGLPLGLLPKSTYRYDQLGIGDGDLLCLYSDGITECESPSEEEFGADRLQQFLIDHRDEPLGSILRGLDEHLRQFALDQPQRDDQTVVLLRRSAGR